MGGSENNRGLMVKVARYLREHGGPAGLLARQVAQALDISPTTRVGGALAYAAQEYPAHVQRTAPGVYAYRGDGTLPGAHLNPEPARKQEKLRIAQATTLANRRVLEEAPAPNGKGCLYEQVGTTREGTVLLQDEGGALWQATRL